ncbi:xanthine dehydrogenase YagT iron-sulfur-binding protein subunit [Paraburkholderia phenoliruptrix BR3459a]|uniref:Xanthine dehydrogenase YagT iron-sulfur-binding protein subunit n=2 Tax=Paraburkholderia phenoliruptrix TaxID=252970 RepID=K0DSQ1_9BURK|nr:xanthine dehydrogenase YagT iron-sulfur-binding protein subunit [Paraburkholderia phenoliruptrix BR3459a]
MRASAFFLILPGTAIARADSSSVALPVRDPSSGEILMNTPTAQRPLDVAPSDVQRLPVSFDINGRKHSFEVEAWTSLLDLLREHCHLTGTKKGCDHGQCGACTAIVNGQRINTCLALAAVHDGASITTIEGLANGEQLHPVQQAFIDHDAFQCGYCTPGQICSAVAMLQEGRAKTAADVRELMSGNLCRCGAYAGIVAAILDAAGIADTKALP